MHKILIIDTGTGNLKNAAKAFGAEVASCEREIRRADKLVFPGVGTFDTVMRNIHHLKDAILEHIQRQKPFFGICIGMQILFERSEEGCKKGLGIFKGTVVRIKNAKTPHMGWNNLIIARDSRILKNLSEKDFFYFVHSFYAEPKNIETSAFAQHFSEYGCINICSVIEENNIFLTQFHPEKSYLSGEKIIENFRRIL